MRERNIKSVGLEFDCFQYTRISLKSENKVDHLHVGNKEIYLVRPGISLLSPVRLCVCYVNSFRAIKNYYFCMMNFSPSGTLFCSIGRRET
jgi:hypothetical protein